MKSIDIKIEPSLFLELACFFEGDSSEYDDGFLELLTDEEMEFLDKVRTSKSYGLSEFYVYSDEKDYDSIISYIKSLSDVDFFYYYHHEDISKDEIKELDQSIVEQTKQINLSLLSKAKDYLGDEIDTDKYEKHIFKLFTDLRTYSPLMLAEKIMGKKFRRLSHYSRYCFIPIMNYTEKPRRIFSTTDLMVMIPLIEKKKSYSLEEIGDILRALSDDTRLKIIRLLSTKSMYGKEIADELGVKAPTITHHIEQLNKCKLLYLEQKGNVKYYTLNRLQYKELIEALSQVPKTENNF